MDLFKYTFIDTVIISFIICSQLMKLNLRIEMLGKHSVKIFGTSSSSSIFLILAT